MRSRGRENSSRQIADVIGMIMIVSMSEAGGSPPGGEPEKIGRKPRWSVSAMNGSRCSATQGPKTRMPQRPSTTLGIAASSSIIVATGAAIRWARSR